MNAKPAATFSTDYVLWLKRLRDLGDKFPFAWKIILDIVDDAQQLVALLNPSTPVPDTEGGLKLLGSREVSLDLKSAFSNVDTSGLIVTKEAEELERQIANLSLQNDHPKLKETLDWNSIIETVRKLYVLLQSNPMLMALILKLLGVTGVISA